MSRLRRIIPFMKSVVAPVATSFKFSVKTDNAGSSGTNQFTIPTVGSGYNYTVVTSEQNLSNQTGNVTLTWTSPGTYDVEISGDFPRIYFNYVGDKWKIINIKRWGNISWTSFNFAFFGCKNLDITATDSPDLSLVTDMSVSFNACENLINSNGSISNWDVSNVTNMATMFGTCFFFNVDIGSWDVSNVTDMSYMFNSTIFNQNISGWTVSSVTNMEGIFALSSFNQNISSWDVSNVTNMNFMFNGCPFNQNISSWNVSNVNTMNYIFSDTTAFNQNISSWDISNVADMGYMFSDAIAFNQLLNFNTIGWTGSAFTSVAVNMGDMFSGSAMSTENYTDTLVLFANIVKNSGNWLGTNFTNQSSMTFDSSRGGGTYFDFAADARNYLLDTFGEITTDWGPGSQWTITGDTVI